MPGVDSSNFRASLKYELSNVATIVPEKWFFLSTTALDSVVAYTPVTVLNGRATKKL